jgi:hypothetical protein
VADGDSNKIELALLGLQSAHVIGGLERDFVLHRTFEGA